MPSRLQNELQQRSPFASLEEEAFLNVVRTANTLLQDFGRVLKPHALTPTQYNALRILRGSHPEALPCSEIGKRMVSPVPDVTRLLDRLELRKLISRSRDSTDRRVVKARISRRGLSLLRKLDRPVAEHLEQMLSHLSDREARSLIKHLERCREPEVR
jgi:DNA-binding MarR family transcriptional regulator